MDELSRYKIDNMPGQLNPNTEFGSFLTSIVKRDDLKTFVEFGSWNGQGSTKSIMDGLVVRDDKPISFVSYEANEERHLVAKAFWETMYKKYVDLILVHGKVSEEIYTLDYIKKHKMYKEEMAHWYNLEVQQIKDAPIVHDVLPETIDFVLFDGGEFATVGDRNFVMEHYEPKIVALDDIDSFKNGDFFEKMMNDDEWVLIARGGHYPDKKSQYTWACFERK